MIRFYLIALLVLAITLSACAPASAPPPSAAATPDNAEAASVSEILPTPTDDPAVLDTLFPNIGNKVDPNMTRIDEQGMVVVEATPLNLGTATETLEFDVVLNTHSVDLSMDLAKLATLTSDTGVSVQATFWDAPRGGHHVIGKLIFPSKQGDISILDGVTKLTLTILDVDAAVRLFEWELK